MDSCCFFDPNNCIFMSWQNTRNSAIVLGTINLAFFLYWYCNLNLISIIAYIVLFFLVTGIVLSHFYLTKPENDDDDYEFFSKEKVEQWVKGFYKAILSYDAYIHKIASMEKTRETVRFFGVVYGLLVLSNWFSDEFLIWAVINGCFVWVPLNKNQHFKIVTESLVKTVQENLNKYIDLVKEKIPKYVEKK